MTPTQILDALIEAQVDIYDLERTVKANERAFGKGLITYRMVTSDINTLAAARDLRDDLLHGAVAHREEWAHDSTICPICIIDREE